VFDRLIEARQLGRGHHGHRQHVEAQRLRALVACRQRYQAQRRRGRLVEFAEAVGGQATQSQRKAVGGRVVTIEFARALQRADVAPGVVVGLGGGRIGGLGRQVSHGGDRTARHLKAAIAALWPAKETPGRCRPGALSPQKDVVGIGAAPKRRRERPL
jgi:hypothetical protein